MAQAIISGLIWFFLFLCVHVLWFHFVKVERSARLIMIVFACCFAGNFGTILVSDPAALPIDQVALRVLYGSLLMGCLFVLYMPFYFTISTSLSVQTLICLREARDRALSTDALRQRFASNEIVAGRLSLMVANGYLAEHRGKYRVTSKGRRIARFFARLKAIWMLGPGG
jgi:hypothetical protein